MPKYSNTMEGNHIVAVECFILGLGFINNSKHDIFYAYFAVQIGIVFHSFFCSNYVII